MRKSEKKESYLVKTTENLLKIAKVSFKRKAWGLRQKSHMILIEIKKKRAIKKEQPNTTGKKPRNFKPIKYIWLLGR